MVLLLASVLKVTRFRYGIWSGGVFFSSLALLVGGGLWMGLGFECVFRCWMIEG